MAFQVNFDDNRVNCWPSQNHINTQAGEPLESVASYRPISLLSTVGKVFEKLLLKRLRALAEEDELIPSHQFGFRLKHATIEQVQRVADSNSRCPRRHETLSNRVPGCYPGIRQGVDPGSHSQAEHSLTSPLHPTPDVISL